MHKCPVCLKSLSHRSGKMTPLRFSRYCPHCGTLLTKKKTLWMLPLFIAFAVCAANFKTHWIFSVLPVVVAVILCVALWKLPYVPYDK